MRDEWYSDKRDLVKWGVLFRLAKKYDVKRILQIAYYNKSNFGKIEIEGEEVPIPDEVLAHFRDIRNIGSISTSPKVNVFNTTFEGMAREDYHELVKSFILEHDGDVSILFLDPDTGIEPNGKASYKHVLNHEIRTLWNMIPQGWIIVFYQHQTNRSGQPWIEPKRKQLADALEMPLDEVKTASGYSIASDVVFFFTTKT